MSEREILIRLVATLRYAAGLTCSPEDVGEADPWEEYAANATPGEIAVMQAKTLRDALFKCLSWSESLPDSELVRGVEAALHAAIDAHGQVETPAMLSIAEGDDEGAVTIVRHTFTRIDEDCGIALRKRCDELAVAVTRGIDPPERGTTANGAAADDWIRGKEAALIIGITPGALGRRAGPEGSGKPIRDNGGKGDGRRYHKPSVADYAAKLNGRGSGEESHAEVERKFRRTGQ